MYIGVTITISAHFAKFAFGKSSYSELLVFVNPTIPELEQNCFAQIRYLMMVHDLAHAYELS